MDFNLKPQWSMWRHNHFTHQYQVCGKCGLAHHRFEMCLAYNKRCFSCDKFGHFARQCFTARSRSSLFGKIRCTKSTKSKVSSEQKNSTKKQQRDNHRLIQYYSNKNSLRELPFSSVRNSAIVNFFDKAVPLKVELKQANIQLRKNKSVISATSELLKRAQENIRTLTCKLVDSQNQLDSTEKLKACLDKITKLEKEKEDNAACMKKISDQNNFLILKCEYQTYEIGNITTQNHELRDKSKTLTDQTADIANQIRIGRTHHINRPNASQCSGNGRFQNQRTFYR
ncbi:Hypothetical predicted protein [Mytilus galloprovincialis]|uniref:CCHC-type domain-containing protein n=1 Tax=Mytilus galloprovincialis TaxID=29158 RepID=A0A8B6ENY8_MYTGA|nr:Hypothetical predicted protein [Mytilus galloprovincialis]